MNSTSNGIHPEGGLEENPELPIAGVSMVSVMKKGMAILSMF